VTRLQLISHHDRLTIYKNPEIDKHALGALNIPVILSVRSVFYYDISVQRYIFGGSINSPGFNTKFLSLSYG